MFFSVVVWLAFSFLGMILPLFLGLVILLCVAPIASGYMAGRSKKAVSIVVISFTTSVLAGVIGLATIGSVPPEQQTNVTGIGWNSNTRILVWVFLNGLLTLTVGYLKFRFNKDS